MGYLKVRTPLKFMVPRDRTELPTQGFSVLKIAILFQVVILSRIPILGWYDLSLAEMAGFVLLLVPQQSWGVSQFTNKEVGSHALTFTIMFLEIFPKIIDFFRIKT